MEKSTHHTATLRNDTLTAMLLSAKPNHSGFIYQIRLISSRMPPPR